MLDAKVAQRVVIHADPATQPPVRIVPLAQSRQLPRASHALTRGVEPERDQHLRIDRRPAGIAPPGLNRRVKPAQVQSIDDHPERAGPVIRGQERLDILGPQLQLRPIRGHDPGRAARSRSLHPRLIRHTRLVARAEKNSQALSPALAGLKGWLAATVLQRSEEHTSELQSPCNLVCRLLLEKKKI